MIYSDFPVQQTSIDEFIRILVPEAKGEDFHITSSQNESCVNLNILYNKNNYSFKYENISDKLPDLNIILIKAGIMKIFEKNYRWGSLTGVRPTKLVRKLLSLGFSRDEIFFHLTNLYLVHEDKAALLMDVAFTELKYLNRDHVNVYIGIPFCPTKCHYCSFASYEIKGAYKDNYLAFLSSLNDEITDIHRFISSKNLKVESVYIGGGTPTILSAEDLDTLLKQASSAFSSPFLKEFTLEGGRPETITDEKLAVAKKYGITRISINPQTFNQKTLDLLNRRHSIEDIEAKYKLAEKYGFIINMDFIIGLKDESTEDILYTLDKIRSFNPENITFHVLALKRASELYKSNHQHSVLDFDAIERKIKEIMSEKGLSPYYMYRQKNSLDSGENLGYAKPGTESIFNIEMIEEFQDTFGIGGGAITKFITPSSIERIVNPKDPIMYIKEIKERTKEKILLYERMYE